MKQSLEERIAALRAQRDAVILAHNYQLPEVQDVADFVGDSLGLSRKAAETDADLIVFCGVYFMAETAAILCPDKTVLIPDEHAGCPMVDMTPVSALRELRRQHPDALVVTYVNSSAALKAESDCCCTSANAVSVVRSIPADREIIFLPDQYLGSYVQEQTGRGLILYPGYCPTHVRIRPADIRRLLREHPGAEVMVHPECRPDVRALADYVESTSGMCRRARESEADEMIVGTEIGLVPRLRRENPGKEFYVASEAPACPNMKRTTLERVFWSLEEM
ncbi:MAG: quinolinate synthase NadA, partial [Candidatus Brocadiia bacterium]